MGRTVRQAGAIPTRNGRVCLVTSRSGLRWVIPKGMIDPGHTAATAAVAEAWEEAGLTGELSPDPVGTYAYQKNGLTLVVTVFRLAVATEASDWPERGERRREWLTPAAAADRVAEPDLKALLLAAAG
jgi:8-oxo-dGTP pyrophosphatase MutT (NUDIX family)